LELAGASLTGDIRRAPCGAQGYLTAAPGRPAPGAGGAVNRSLSPRSVRYMSATTATPHPATAHDATRRHNEQTARRPRSSQARRRFRGWWQVLGSNQRRLSRRFYSTLLLPRRTPLTSAKRAPRRVCWLPPSAVRPWTPGSGVRVVHRPWRNRPRTGADRPTDGADESGYADRPPGFLGSDLAFHDSGRCMAGVPTGRTGAWGRPPWMSLEAPGRRTRPGHGCSPSGKAHCRLHPVLMYWSHERDA
jgi:hypothetical protein